MPLGILCGAFPFFSKLSEPFLEFFRYLPAPAFGALAVAVLGIYDGPKIAIIFIGTFFQQVLVVANTTRKLDPSLLEAAQTLGASRAQLLFKVVVPGIIVDLYTDMRILLGWAWTYLIVAELIGTMSGISYFISQQARYRNYQNVFAAIFIIGFIGLGCDVLLAAGSARSSSPGAPRSEARRSSRWPGASCAGPEDRPERHHHPTGMRMAMTAAAQLFEPDPAARATATRRRPVRERFERLYQRPVLARDRRARVASFTPSRARRRRSSGSRFARTGVSSSASSAPRDAASRRSSASWRGSTPRRRARCASTATRCGARAATAGWSFRGTRSSRGARSSRT